MATWYEDLYDEFTGNGKSFVDFMGDRFYNAGQTMDRIGTGLGLSREDKNKIEYAVAGIPIIGDTLRARDNFNAMEDYMRNTGTSWADIPYPSRVMGAGSIGRVATSAYNFVSDNISTLYDLEELRTARTTRKLVRQQTRPKNYRW